MIDLTPVIISTSLIVMMIFTFDLIQECEDMTFFIRVFTFFISVQMNTSVFRADPFTVIVFHQILFIPVFSSYPSFLTHQKTYFDTFFPSYSFHHFTWISVKAFISSTAFSITLFSN